MYLTNNQDLVVQIADEKAKRKKKDESRRRCYQAAIFLICFALNFINRLREQFIYIW